MTSPERGIEMEKDTLILDPFELKVYIEFLRLELMDIGQKQGLCHEQTIQASIELDYFINEYQKIVS
ncbi:aspartyl-phosphate phosphatase Spo0E family protein [Mesobacillus foraminis]|nr:aspartyl-phosphate phosphatase Spo0E family protein [Mesobacillus foraminis]